MAKLKILYSTIVFAFISFLQPALSFFLLPIYLKHFPVSEYGIYSLINTLTSFFGIIAAVRISSAIYTYYYDFSNSDQKVNAYIGNILGFTLLSGAILAGVTYWFGNDLFMLIFSTKEISFAPLGFYSVLTGIGLSIVLPYNILLRNKKEILKFAFIQLFLVISTVILQVVYIIFLEQGVEGALFARMLATTITAGIVLLINARHITFRFKKIFIQQSLHFSIPFIPFSIVSWMALYGDRFVLEKYYSLDMVGVYSLLIAICMLILMANEALIGGVQPYLYDYYSQKNKGKQINLIYKYYIGAVLLVTSIVILGGTNINIITDNSGFLRIVKYLPIAALVYFVSSYYNLFKAKLIYQKKSKLISGLYISTSIITFVLYFILIPILSIWGAILSNLIGFVMISMTFFYFSHKDQVRSVNLADILFFPLIGCAIIIVCFLSAKFGYLSYLMSAWIQFVFVVIICSFHFKSEIKKLLGIIFISN